MMNRRAYFLAAVGAACALAGCTSHLSPIDIARRGPFYVPINVHGDASLAPSLLRVVLLPIDGGSVASEETVESLDPVFAAALERQMRFEVVVLSREECAKCFGVPELLSTDRLPPNFIDVMATKFGAQGVLFVDLTAYAAYRPLSLGLRAKLAQVGDRRLIWGFDEVLSTGDPLIVNSVRHYYSKSELGSVPFDLSTDALQSPLRFAAFAADMMFRTLPPR